MARFITAKQFFKYLPVVWMVIATHVLAAQPTRLIDTQTELSIETESVLCDVDTIHFDTKTQPTNKIDVVTFQDSQYLTLPGIDAPLMTEPLLEQWPIQSKINTYRTIISYQYFVSSLDNIS